MCKNVFVDGNTIKAEEVVIKVRVGAASDGRGRNKDQEETGDFGGTICVPILCLRYLRMCATFMIIC